MDDSHRYGIVNESPEGSPPPEQPEEVSEVDKKRLVSHASLLLYYSRA